MELFYLPSELHNIIASYIDESDDLFNYENCIFSDLNYITLITYRFPAYIQWNLDNGPKEKYLIILYFHKFKYSTLFDFDFHRPPIGNIPYKFKY